MSSVRMLVRIISSSSTSITTGLRLSDTLLDSFGFGFGLLQGNANVEGGSGAQQAFEGDCAAVVVDGPADHHQTEAGADADGLGGEALLEDLGLVLRTNSAPGVGDPDVYLPFFECGAGGDCAAAFDGLAGLDREIE